MLLREHAHVRGRAESGNGVVFVPLLVQMDEGVGDVLGNNLGVTSSVVAGWVGHGNVCGHCSRWGRERMVSKSTVSGQVNAGVVPVRGKR